ncbi:hypothetical protein FIBSPDRAFT_885332 [Athelia psychrophila]|uniref:Uncharacterized protein n=1 Tax=Athelia psychrophila TaxID=1759441 RepID=A0A166S062_9AGAM|nr:hypothetical protein FIBSPDRAFT_885332 [Fibularhizoctonia sp. CBS 109695]
MLYNGDESSETSASGSATWRGWRKYRQNQDKETVVEVTAVVYSFYYTPNVPMSFKLPHSEINSLLVLCQAFKLRRTRPVAETRRTLHVKLSVGVELVSVDGTQCCDGWFCGSCQADLQELDNFSYAVLERLECGAAKYASSTAYTSSVTIRLAHCGPRVITSRVAKEKKPEGRTASIWRSPSGGSVSMQRPVTAVEVTLRELLVQK